MTARRIKSLHFNLKDGENVIFHREHRSKRGRRNKKPSSLQYRRFKIRKKYGKDAKLFDI